LFHRRVNDLLSSYVDRRLIVGSGPHGEPLSFDQFCDILIPVITGGSNDVHDDYSIWLAFRAFDKNADQYIQAEELETLMHILGKSVSRQRIRHLIDRVDWDHNGQLDYHEFRDFIVRGYARELLMMDVTREIVYSRDQLQVPANCLI
jgi:Ca2+-binding EF-hand superfamily protein